MNQRYGSHLVASPHRSTPVEFQVAGDTGADGYWLALSLCPPAPTISCMRARAFSSHGVLEYIVPCHTRVTSFRPVFYLHAPLEL